MDEINFNLQVEELDGMANVCHLSSEFEDLWSPKKIAPYVFPQSNGEININEIINFNYHGIFSS